MSIIQKSNTKRLSISIYDLAVVGVMAAICFVVTYFIKIPIPTPVGQTMIKVANAFCLLAGALFGGWRGGLAAGIGSMFYDLMDPAFITSAPVTLVRFFLMGCICGMICFSGGSKGKSFWRNAVGISAGSLFSMLFYIAESILKQMLLGQPFQAAVLACVPKMVTSGINMAAGIALALVLLPLFRNGLERAGVYRKIWPQPGEQPLEIK